MMKIKMNIFPVNAVKCSCFCSPPPPVFRNIFIASLNVCILLLILFISGNIIVKTEAVSLSLTHALRCVQ